MADWLLLLAVLLLARLPDQRRSYTQHRSSSHLSFAALPRRPASFLAALEFQALYSISNLLTLVLSDSPHSPQQSCKKRRLLYGSSPFFSTITLAHIFWRDRSNIDPFRWQLDNGRWYPGLFRICAITRFSILHPISILDNSIRLWKKRVFVWIKFLSFTKM